ncbi:Type II secretion system protein F [uncultured bacterium]|nr:Type II secretion system protein F [uncultured bacterium]
MPSFNYKARDKQGSLVTGSLEAASMEEIETSLDRLGLIPIKVAAAGPSFRFPDLKRYFEKVPQQEIIVFSRQLATLFGAGVPLTKSLSTLERQSTVAPFRRIVKTLREDIEAGTSLAAALRKHPSVFPELYASMIEAGEAGGILEEVLRRLASMLEKNSENRARIKSATLYPKIVVVGLAVAVVILMSFVVPRFSQLYGSFKIDLPLPTRLLIAISDFTLMYWYFFLAGAIVVFFALKAFLRTGRGKDLWDRSVIKIPVFGPIILKSVLSRFSRVLGSLYRSGLPILQSLDIVSRAVDNRSIAAEVKRIEAEVRAGKPLSIELGRSGKFPPMVVQMVAVGEDTGNLDEMLDKVSEYYDQEVDSSIRNLASTLEPVLLTFIFAVVLFLALAIFLPMWDIIKVVKR